MAWTESGLQSLVIELRTRGGDFTDVEVKRGTGGVPQCSETLCAFGNMPGGGTILVGLDEASGFEAVGVLSIADTEAGIAAQARTAVRPPVGVEFQRAQVDGVDIVVASVAGLPLHQRPCRVGGRAYLRQADGDYVMSEPEIAQILSLHERPRHDATPVVGSSRDDLDSRIAGDYLTQVRSSSRRLADASDEEILERRRSLRDGVLTTAGVYALGRYPQEFEPSLSITAAVQLPAEWGARTRDLQHMDGPLPELLDSAMEWVRRNTQTTIRVGADGHARDSSEIPMVAVRELVANALVHRDVGPHTRGKRVEIRLLDDQLVITSPGGLWGVSSAQLGQPGGKSAVNEFLYDICKFTRTPQGDRIIEGEGGGIREVEASLRSAGLAAPRYVDRGISFTVIVPRHALLPSADIDWLTINDPGQRMSSMQKQIVTSMRHGQLWTNATVRTEFPGIDSREAQRALGELVDLQFARAVGDRGLRRYEIHPRCSRATLSAGPKVLISRPESLNTLDPFPRLVPEVASTSGKAALNRPTVERETGSNRVVLDALANGPATVRKLTETTGLTTSRVRTALRRLIASGRITVNGGWGVRGTTYRRNGDEGSA